MEWVAFPTPGDLPDPGIKPGSPALQTDSLPTELSIREAHIYVCVCNGILLSYKNEWNVAICNSIGGLGGCYANWNKLDSKIQTPYDITYVWNSQQLE